MAKNKIYTQSYFIKHLIENQFQVKKIDIQYKDTDTRYWTICTFYKDNPILITCFKETNSFYFNAQIKNGVNFKIQTLSMKSCINILKEICINNYDENICTENN